MKKLILWIKQETVLGIALILAVVSAFVIPPDIEYLKYIDFRTLAILFCLMSVMAGLREIGAFEAMAQKMLGKVKNVRQLVMILILLCFFFSMLITNDVALITFVPFTFIVLDLLPSGAKEKWIIPLVVMQTIAANLGSMLTPIGNPQNLYLYGKAGISLGSFIWLMLPYTALSFLLLCTFAILKGKDDKARVQVAFENIVHITERKKLIIYLGLFFFSLLTVAKVVPYGVSLCLTIIVVLIVDRKILKKVDYSLLLTFVGFFIFIGNMGRLEAFREFLAEIMEGKEVITAVLASQVISNVPAALLLSGFTQETETLIVGTNLGGLGTLIASMASLISYKYIVREDGALKKKYFLYFTGANIAFLLFLLCLYGIIQ